MKELFSPRYSQIFFFFNALNLNLQERSCRHGAAAQIPSVGARYPGLGYYISNTHRYPQTYLHRSVPATLRESLVILIITP